MSKSLYMILEDTGSQWRSKRTGLIWEYFVVKVTTRAAVFCMRWRRDSWTSGITNKREFPISRRDVTMEWTICSVGSTIRIFSNPYYVADVKWSRTNCVRNVALERHRWIKNDTQIANLADWFDVIIPNSNKGNRDLRKLLWRTNQHELGLTVINFQEVDVHPLTNFMNTSFDAIDAGLGMLLWGIKRHLCVSSA